MIPKVFPCIACSLAFLELPTTPPVVDFVRRTGKTTCTGDESVTVSLTGLVVVKTAGDLVVLAGDTGITTDMFNLVSSSVESTLLSFRLPSSEPGPLTISIAARRLPALAAN